MQALSEPGLFRILRGVPLRLAAHAGRSIRSILLHAPAHPGLRSLGDSRDSGRADGSEGGTAGRAPALPKATRERREGTRWVPLVCQEDGTSKPKAAAFPLLCSRTSLFSSDHPPSPPRAWLTHGSTVWGAAGLLPRSFWERGSGKRSEHRSWRRQRPQPPLWAEGTVPAVSIPAAQGASTQGHCPRHSKHPRVLPTSSSSPLLPHCTWGSPALLQLFAQRLSEGNWSNTAQSLFPAPTWQSVRSGLLPPQSHQWI